MSSACKKFSVALCALIALAGCANEGARPAASASASVVPAAKPVRPADDVLRVCADPNNLPFSNDRGEGFENAIAELVARDLGRRVEYTWWPQRRGFIRATLRAGVCDVVMGVPEDYELALTTKPYYRSSYVFVSRPERHLALESLDDPRLRRFSIGLHVVGDDYSNVPPGDALVARGITENIRGYSIYGDYTQPNPPAALIDAVAKKEVDVAIAWGPLAGFFGSREGLDIAPVAEVRDVPLQFSISMGVRRKDKQLRDELNRVLERREREIESVLRRFHVPTVEARS